ncbi:MAG: TetR/AcrR family transcriptional regulator [Bdellovibrio sp.]|nr:TetR/AcrR family transcriptional regulator [Bdellovibrio sp.]
METKAQALEIAKTQLQLRGYNGFSFQDIANELGIKKASLHYYFSSKEDLGLALIEDYAAAFQQWADKLAELSPYEKIEKYILMFYSFAQDNLKICPAGVFCVDFNALPVRMQKSITELQDTQRRWLEKALIRGIKDGDFKKSLKAKDTANLLIAACQGGLQLARFQDNCRVMKSTCQTLLDLLTDI